MIEKPIISPQEAVAFVKSGDRIMCGGFMGCGSADTIFQSMLKHCTHKDLILICNDGAWGIADKPQNGVAPMIAKKLFKKFIGCHIGLNPELQRQNNAGETEVTLMPMGTFIERIRCGGAGLGGVLTPTGLGTEVAEGKHKITVEGKEYLLEVPLRADIAFIKAQKADKAGNLVHSKTARNFNSVMATAADLVIVEVEEIVEIGAVDPNHVQTPFIFVDYIVQGGY
ncbi:MAG: CoA transferase subunit A [Brevinema sp.]